MTPSVTKDDVYWGYSSTEQVGDSLIETPIANTRLTKTSNSISKSSRRRSHRINLRKLIFDFSSLDDTSGEVYRPQNTGVGDFDIRAFEKRVKKRLQCGLSTVPPPKNAFRIVRSGKYTQYENRSERKGSVEKRHLGTTSHVSTFSEVNYTILGQTHQQSSVDQVIFRETGIDGEFMKADNMSLDVEFWGK